MKRAVVVGAGGFLGSHLCHRLKREGYWVRGLSRSPWRIEAKNPCDEYWPADLRERKDDLFRNIDEVFQFACEVGGLGYIMDRKNDAECLRNSTQVDLNVLEACRTKGVKRVFFASSGCVYNGGSGVYRESDAYPAHPLNEFAWQKLFAERLYLSYAQNFKMQVRIGRLFNTFGVGMPWTGGREKSVAALCRKVAECKEGGTIKVWGDGGQVRDYMPVRSTLDGVIHVMDSDCREPVNIGSGVGVSIRKLLKILRQVSNKDFTVEWTDGPTGVRRIVADTSMFREETSAMLDGMGGWDVQESYDWVAKQVLDAKQK